MCASGLKKAPHTQKRAFIHSLFRNAEENVLMDGKLTDSKRTKTAGEGGRSSFLFGPRKADKPSWETILSGVVRLFARWMDAANFAAKDISIDRIVALRSG